MPPSVLLRGQVANRTGEQDGMRRPTRSSGLLEGVLAAKRAAVADGLIPDHLRGGALLDLGCGVTPHFLLRTRFATKVGVDPCLGPWPQRTGIDLLRKDITEIPWGFVPQQFSAITMLAVLEHRACPSRS